MFLLRLLKSLIYVEKYKHKTEKIEIKNRTVLTTKNNQMSKFLIALRVAGDVAEIIVASSIVVEFIERYRAKKKTPAPVLIDPADEPIKPAEVTTTENK